MVRENTVFVNKKNLMILRDNPTSIFSMFYSCIHLGDGSRVRGLAPSVRPLFPPTSPPSNAPGRAPEATDRLDIVVCDY